MQNMMELRKTNATSPLIRWSAVFAGGVIGIAGLGLLTALWVAIGYGSDVRWFRTSLAWWIGGSAIVAMFIAGGLAGWLSGARGPIVGFWHGVTVWGLALIVLVSVTLPSVASNGGFSNPTSATSNAALSPAFYTGATLWAFFWAVLIGLGAAALGGVLGGAGPEMEIDLTHDRTTTIAADRQEMAMGGTTRAAE